MDVEETPVVGQALHVAVAQRYSVLVTARNDISSNWGIHLNQDVIPPQFGLPPIPSPNTSASTLC